MRRRYNHRTMPLLDPKTVVQMPLGGMKNFIYLFACPETSSAAVIDPAWDVDAILAEANSRHWKIEKLLLTHTHGDHTNGVAEMAKKTNAPVLVHALEQEAAPAGPAGHVLVEDGDTVSVGNLELRVLHTPGHSPGAICYETGGCLFTGDTLFVGRTGRMVFPGSSQEQMYASTLRLRQLSPELTIFPGHGYGDTSVSTIHQELERNPFLRCDSFDAFRNVADGWERENS